MGNKANCMGGTGGDKSSGKVHNDIFGRSRHTPVSPSKGMTDARKPTTKGSGPANQ